MNNVKKMKPKFKPGARKKALYSDTNLSTPWQDYKNNNQ